MRAQINNPTFMEK